MLIYLNGTSSSGKTSIAIELQKLITKPIFYFSIDTLLYSLSPEIIETLKGERQSKINIDWLKIFQGYFDCLVALHKSGNWIIADCPVYNDELFKLFKSSHSQIAEALVCGLFCSTDILKKREIARGDRILGLAEKQNASIHSYIEYDMKLDSDTIDPINNAKLILEKISVSQQ